MSALVLGLQTIAALDLSLFNAHVQGLRESIALRKALNEQMANTLAHQRRADVALDWHRLAVKQRDDLQAKLDEAQNIARMNGAERDALRAELDRLRDPGEKWDGRIGGGRWVPQRFYREMQADRDEALGLLHRWWSATGPEDDASVAEAICGYLGRRFGAELDAAAIRGGEEKRR